MKEITLTRGLTALVDDEDHEMVLSTGRWVATQIQGNTAYARCGRVQMHALITGATYVDHRNGNGLDNRRANLRPATHTLNMANKQKYRNNRSGFKGVHRAGLKWRAAIGGNDTRRNLGRFDSAEAAARAYDAAALDMWGEFARINFPEKEQAA